MLLSRHHRRKSVRRLLLAIYVARVGIETEGTGGRDSSFPTNREDPGRESETTLSRTLFYPTLGTTTRGRATNLAKLSRTTPAELFSASSRGVVREREREGERASLDCLSRGDSSPTCETADRGKFFRNLPACLPTRLPPACSSADRTGQVTEAAIDWARVARQLAMQQPGSGRYRGLSVPVRHNRISIGSDLFIHDAGHARQIFSLAKFFPSGSSAPERTAIMRSHRDCERECEHAATF